MPETTIIINYLNGLDQMLGKYPGRTVHFFGVAIAAAWLTATLINNTWPETPEKEIKAIDYRKNKIS